MSLESFYGGKQGVSPVIKARFKYIDTEDPAYIAAKDGNKKTDDDLKLDTMESCFSDTSYTKVWYNELCIIDTDNKNNQNNGKIYRRTFRRTENEIAADGGTLHAEYIGCIVGPSSGFPRVNFSGSVDDVKSIAKNKFKNNNVNASYSFPSTNGTIINNVTSINDFDNLEEQIAKKSNNQLIPGATKTEVNGPYTNFEKGIHYSWVNIRNDINGKPEDTYIYMGFAIPYNIFDFNFVEGDWDESFNSNFDNETDYLNGVTPFYQKFTITVPKAVPGNEVGFIRRTKFGNFKNANNDENKKILYDYQDIVRNDYRIPDYGTSLPWPTFDGEDLTADTDILVYTYYIHDLDVKINENNEEEKEKYDESVSCYLSKIKDIEEIVLSEDGTFKITYSDNTEYTSENKIKWINKIEAYHDGDENRNKIRIIYNTKLENSDELINETQELQLPYIYNLWIQPNSNHTLNSFNYSYYTSNGFDPNNVDTIKDGYDSNNSFNFKFIDGLLIDPFTKEIKYHSNPVNAVFNEDDGYKSFGDGVYLNSIKKTFVDNDGHLYVLYSSANSRYVGDPDDSRPYGKGKNLYIKKDQFGQIWHAEGNFPLESRDELGQLVWWLDLGPVTSISKGLRLSATFNSTRYEEYWLQKTGDTFDPAWWDSMSTADFIRDYLNSPWSLNDGRNVSPYTNGNIYTYDDNKDLVTSPSGNLSGQILFFKGNAYYYDFSGTATDSSDDNPSRQEWKLLGAWASSDSHMQLKIKKNNNDIIPSSPDLYEEGFYFLEKDLETIDEILLPNIWAVSDE